MNMKKFIHKRKKIYNEKKKKKSREKVTNGKFTVQPIVKPFPTIVFSQDDRTRIHPLFLI